MSSLSSSPLRPVSEQEQQAYQRDGAVVLRGLIAPEWIDRMRAAVERALQRPGVGAVEYAEGKGRFLGDFLLWMRDHDFDDFARRSPLREIASALLGGSQVRLFYDQLLVKEPNTQEETPWHQDLPYWPVRGNDILSLWVPFDRVTAESGAMRYVKGSHAAGALYQPTPFGKNSGFASVLGAADLPPFPDTSAFLRDANILVCEMAPGDVIAHHPLVFHWSPGNLDPDHRRRALALRYLGDDAIFDESAANFLAHPNLAKQLREPLQFKTGDRPGGANFPIVWPRAETN
ncbi:MAG: phytanoyl-CoA dioxygenase family protein [Hyphomonadaceae bacterium]|nr:phytanoyl-CoA dioxygenase family protein [Hyphomonadaceae bacterium]